MTPSPNTLTPTDKLLSKLGKWPIEGDFVCKVGLTFITMKPPESMAEQVAIDQFNAELEVLAWEFASMLEKVCKEKFL